MYAPIYMYMCFWFSDLLVTYGATLVQQIELIGLMGD